MQPVKRAGNLVRFPFRHNFRLEIPVLFMSIGKAFFYLGKESRLHLQTCNFMIDQNFLDGAVGRVKTTKWKWESANGTVILEKVA